MNILRENIEQLNDVITIEIEPNDYREQVEKSLKDIKRKANIPGFRAGHVPMGMINKMYKKSITADEISKLINDKLLDYIKENNINILFEPIALPDRTKGDFEKPEDNFSFSFEIGLNPEFEINYEQVKNIKYLKIKASDKDIEEEIKKLQHKMGKFSSTEEVVEEDMLLVTVLAESDIKEEFSSSLMMNYIKAEKQKDFIGKRLHDTIEIDTTRIFKGDYERATFLKTKVEELETAAQNITIKIDAIHHIESAKINDEFFEKAFPNKEVTDDKGLKEHFKNQIERSYDRDEKMFYKEKVMKTLMEIISIDLPDSFIKRFLIETNSENYTAENMEEKYPGIRKSVVYQLMEERISKDGDINVDRKETIEYIKDYIRISYFGVSADVELPEEQETQITNFSNEMIKNTENVKNAYDNIFSEKIIAELIKRTNPKIEKVTFDEFMTVAAAKPEEKKTKKGKTKKETTEDK